MDVGYELLKQLKAATGWHHEKLMLEAQFYTDGKKAPTTINEVPEFVTLVARNIAEGKCRR